MSVKHHHKFSFSFWVDDTVRSHGDVTDLQLMTSMMQTALDVFRQGKLGANCLHVGSTQEETIDPEE